MKAKIINIKEWVFEPFEIAILFESQSEVNDFYEELEDSTDISNHYSKPILEALLPKTKVRLEPLKKEME